MSEFRTQVDVCSTVDIPLFTGTTATATVPCIYIWHSLLLLSHICSVWLHNKTKPFNLSEGLVPSVGARQNICFLCGRWSPGESWFICLNYCVLAVCLTSKAPETYCRLLRLLIQKFPVIFLWPSHFWCSSFEERRNQYQAIKSCRSLVIPKKPLLIITPHKHQTNQPRSQCCKYSGLDHSDQSFTQTWRDGPDNTIFCFASWEY
jgi:hypothetical protein